MNRIIRPINSINGRFGVPADKSISHRTVIFGSIAKGVSIVRNFLFSADCISSIECMRALGVRILAKETTLEIEGSGMSGLKPPGEILDAGNSGTTIRILSGILAASSFTTVITGDESLRSRPMARIIEPLRLMGGDISGIHDKYPPLTITGKALKPMEYRLPIPSAQVKSCILAAAVNTKGITTIVEPCPSRDHTERTLERAGAYISGSNGIITLKGPCVLNPFDTFVPGDISSAAYLMVAASILRDSRIVIENVGLNPTRTGIIAVMKRMGAIIAVPSVRETAIGEPFGDIIVESADLKGTTVENTEIPLLIDEIPLIAVLGACARGVTAVKGAEELRVKESDRIKTLVENMFAMGVEIKEKPDGFEIEGPQKFKGAELDSFNDHRIAMTSGVAALAAQGDSVIKNADSVSISFPGFWDSELFQG